VEARRCGKAFRSALSRADANRQNVRPFRGRATSWIQQMAKPHPHFDDRGTLSWHTRYADALAEAKRDKKIVFIEMGREA
jgi:hypothetical protein